MSKTYRHLPYSVAFEKVMGVPLVDKVITENLSLEQLLNKVKEKGTYLTNPQRIEVKNHEYSTLESHEYLRVENFSHIEKVGGVVILPINFYEKTDKNNAFRYKTEKEHKEYESTHGDSVNFANVHIVSNDDNVDKVFTRGRKNSEEPLVMSELFGNDLVAYKIGEYTYFYSILGNKNYLPYWSFRFDSGKFNHLDPYVIPEKYRQLEDYAFFNYHYHYATVFRTKHDNFDVSQIVDNFPISYRGNPAEIYEINGLAAKVNSEEKFYPLKNHKKRRVQERVNITEGLKLFRNGNVHCLDIDFDKNLGKWDS